jgi:hypothetical protein
MLSQQYLKESLKYNQFTGIFTWIKRPARHFESFRIERSTNARMSGVNAGTKDKKGYIVICLHGKLYKAHRLAFLYVNGSFPENEVDHIDGDKSNNKFTNLRDVSKSDNMKNASLPSTNTSGTIGVGFHVPANKWRAHIKIEGVYKHLGLFDEMSGAILARKEAENFYNFHKNHGRKNE